MKISMMCMLMTATIGWAVSSCSNKTPDISGGEGTTIDVSGGILINYANVEKATTEGIITDGANPDDLLENSTFPTTVRITFGETVYIDNPLEGNGVVVTQNGDDVTIDATATGVAYELVGNSEEGSIKIYSDKKFKLVLAGLTLRNSDGPAINIQSKKRVFVVLKDNTTNILEDGTNYAESSEDQKGTFFSEGQLIFSGSGALTVTGNYKHGMVSDDYIRFISGNITVANAVTDGIHTNDGVFIDGGTFHINAASDGIEADEGPIIINAGDFTIQVVDDGIAASYTGNDDAIDPFVVINGGKFQINTTEGEGIESKSVLSINGGEIYINAYDDALNAGTAIYINDGLIVAYSRSNDGVDSNGIITITGGRTFAIGAQQPEGGFDCDNSTFKIVGGLAIGVGGNTSSPTASVSTQRAVILGEGTASTIYSLLDKDNKELVTFKSPVSFSTLLIASNQLVQGGAYKLVSVSAVENGTAFNGLFSAGNFYSPTVRYAFTQSSLVTQVGGRLGPGRF